MHPGQVLAELWTGLRRNVSMTISLVITLFVSLTLAGAGLLIYLQSHKTEDYFESRLQLQVQLCTGSSGGANCLNGAASTPQKQAVAKALGASPEVESVHYRTGHEAYEKAKQLYDQSASGRRIFAQVKPSAFGGSYFAQLKNPDHYLGAQSAVSGLPGVAVVQNLNQVLAPIYTFLRALRIGAWVIAGALVLAAVLQVANTIRLSAYARRREIGIMRLVGASSLHIQLPFLLESLLAALLAGVLACGALALLTKLFVYGFLRDKLRITTWVGWHEAVIAGAASLVLSLVLALVPTLLMTRRYLDV